MTRPRATRHLQHGERLRVHHPVVADKVPNTTNNFVFLSRDGYYDGVTFHRVIPGFMAQGGDRQERAEAAPDTSSRTSSIPNSDTTSPESCPWRTPARHQRQPVLHHVRTDIAPGQQSRRIGEVIEGMDVVNAISPRDPMSARTPGDAVASITITES